MNGWLFATELSFMPVRRDIHKRSATTASREPSYLQDQDDYEESQVHRNIRWQQMAHHEDVLPITSYEAEVPAT